MGYDLTTENGYNMYDMSSMLQKAIRRGDIPHAGYAATEMFGKFRQYTWRRLLEVSAEDCFGIITKEIVALAQADAIVNDRRGNKGLNYIFVAKAVVLLCMARKNRDADYVAVNFMWGDRTLSDDEYDEFVDYEQVLQLKERDRITIPEWVYDAHTKRGKKAGKNAIDFWKSEHECLEPRQLSLFDNGSWGGWYEHYDSEDGLSPRTRREYPEYAAGKETDPTHNGENMEMHEPNWGNQPRRK